MNLVDNHGLSVKNGDLLNVVSYKQLDNKTEIYFCKGVVEKKDETWLIHLKNGETKNLEQLLKENVRIYNSLFPNDVGMYDINNNMISEGDLLHIYYKNACGLLGKCIKIKEEWDLYYLQANILKNFYGELDKGISIEVIEKF